MTESVKYGLALLVVHPDAEGFFEITRDHYDRIIAASEGLWQVLQIEEKFEAIIGNFIEWELSSIEISLRNMAAYEPPTEWLDDARSLMNRRTGNFLSSCRAYLDHARKHYGSIRAEEHSSEELNQYISERYDSSQAYRVLEALRNYVQHNGFPIHGVHYLSEWIGEPGKGKMRHSFRSTFDPGAVKADPDFKKAVLVEVGEERLNIAFLIREYLEQLGLIQEFIRNNLRSITDAWDKIFEDAAKLFPRAGEHLLKALAVVMQIGDGEYQSRKFLVLKMITRRQELIAKNFNQINLSKSFVSNEVL